MTIYPNRSDANVAASHVTAHAVAKGSSARFVSAKDGAGFSVKRAAYGPATVVSTTDVECHGASAYGATDVNGARRVQVNADILGFWVSQGVARTTCPRNASCPRYVAGDCTGGMHARDMVNGGAAWLPMAGQANTGRADTAELSHVVARVNGGAYCACNLLPETGAVNAARPTGDNVSDLSPSARALFAAWPAYWTANVARKASLARLA